MSFINFALSQIQRCKWQIVPLTFCAATGFYVWLGGNPTRTFSLTHEDRFCPIVVVYGPPGSGTEQIAKKISEEYDMKYVSAENVFEKEANNKLSPASQYLAKIIESKDYNAVSNKIRAILMDRALTDYDYVERGIVLCGHPVDELSARVMKTQVHNTKRIVILNADEHTAKVSSKKYLRDSVTGDLYHTDLYPAPAEIATALVNGKPRLEPYVLSDREFEKQYDFYQKHKNDVIKTLNLEPDEISVIDIDENADQVKVWSMLKPTLDDSILSYRVIENERESKYRDPRFKHAERVKTIYGMNRSGSPPHPNIKEELV